MNILGTIAEEMPSLQIWS